MLNNVLNLVKETVSNAINNDNVVPEDKKSQAVETTTHAVAEGLKNNISLDNLSNITSLFRGGTTTTNNPIVSNISSTVTNALVKNVGLSQGIANTIASSVVPLVMKVISGKVNDPNEKGFDVQSLVNTFSGGNSGGGINAGNIMSTVGKLFGK